MKEISKLVSHLEPQGVTSTRTKKGLLLRLPDGSSTMLHFTGSDVREQHNVRARLRRAGLTWPGDEVELGALITEHKPTRATLAKAEQALAQWEQKSINGLQLRRLVSGDAPDNTDNKTPAGMTNVAAQRALYHLGWEPRGKSTNRRWYRPEPEPLPEVVPVLAWQDGASDARLELAAAEAVRTEQLEHTEPKRQLALVPASAYAPEPEPEPEPEELSAPAEAEPEELSAAAAEQQSAELRPDPDAAQPGSWAMELEHLPNDTTIEQLWVYIQALGLTGEVRVWRHG